MGRHYVGFALALLAAPAASVVLHNSSTGSPCDCVSWTEHFASVEGGCEFMGPQFCKAFYMRVKKPACMDYKWNSPESKGDQLCPVSPECSELNGGLTDHGRKYKMCTGDELKLGNLAPRHLYEFANNYKLDFGTLSKAAYPITRKVYWPYAKQFFQRPKKFTNLTKQEIKDLEEIVATEKPHIVDSLASGPPFAIVVGKTAYQIELNDFWIQNFQFHKNGDIWEFPNLISGVRCVAKCPAIPITGEAAKKPGA